MVFRFYVFRFFFFHFYEVSHLIFKDHYCQANKLFFFIITSNISKNLLIHFTF